MQHRGEIVQKAVEESNIPITKLAEKLRISRSTLYKRFDEPELDWDFIVQIGKLIREDIIKKRFVEDAPENMVSEDKNEYRSKLDECQQELIKLNKKYIDLIESFNEVKEENFKLRLALGDASGNSRTG